MTNTQTVVDAPHADLRRARAASVSLIPTTTGSATAIGLIFPELQGRLTGLAVRVPLLNASLTDCVFELARPTTVEEVNGLLEAAAAGGPLAGHPRLRATARSCRSTSAAIRARRSSTRCRRWSSTGRRSRSSPGTTTSGATRTGSSSSRGRSPPRSRRRAMTARAGDLRNYVLVTGAYWADTLADGASRILVLFYFYELGYSPFAVASLFLFYEVFGIVTNLVGGWLAARLGPQDDAVPRARRPGLRAEHARRRAGGMARRAVRHGGAGAVGHRQGPHEDELQERGQARRADGRRGRSFAGSRS